MCAFHRFACLNFMKDRAIACLVCGSHTENTNLGVYVCRACSNFYKRARALNRKYTCRQSHRKCDVRRDLPFMCRSCRYDKCVASGMKLPSHLRSEEETTCSEQPTCSFAEKFNDSVIERMGREFKACCERRYKKEISLRATLLYGSTRLVAPSGESLFLAKNDFMMDTAALSAADVVLMCTNAFREFALMTPLDQQRMFKSFVGCFYLLESNYLTQVNFPGSDRYYMTSPTTVLDLEDLESALTGIEENRQEFLRLAKYYADKSFGLTRPAIREADLTETEFNAAMCLTIWGSDLTSSFPESAIELGYGIKSRVYEELNWYYKYDLKCEDFATRLCRLMMVIHTVQEASALLVEEYQTYRLLGIFRDDDFLLKLVL